MRVMIHRGVMGGTRIRRGEVQKCPKEKMIELQGV